MTIHVSADSQMIMGSEAPWSIRCKSTETKPVAGVPNDSMLVELDTGNIFYMDNGTWQPFGGEE